MNSINIKKNETSRLEKASLLEKKIIKKAYGGTVTYIGSQSYCKFVDGVLTCYDCDPEAV